GGATRVLVCAAPVTAIVGWRRSASCAGGTPGRRPARLEMNDEFAVRMSAAFAERRCVSAWLGHGHGRFLGFGDVVIADRSADGSCPEPPFELETNFAEWWI